MNDVNIGKDNSRHSFVFTGKGGEYFLFVCEFFTDNYYSGNIWTVGIDKMPSLYLSTCDTQGNHLVIREQVVPFC